MNEQRKWNWDSEGITDPERQKVRMLDVIANYLEQIDGRLERLANQQPGACDKVVLELKGIQGALNRKP